MYGNEFMLKYLDVNQLTSLLTQYHIAWTIFYPNNPPHDCHGQSSRGGPFL